MSKPKLGTKRVDPETGKKFYDLNRDPIISPYTGISYPLSYFESHNEIKEDEDLDTEEFDEVLEKPEFISLEDVDDEVKAHDDIPDIDDDDVTLDDDDTFLETNEDDEDDDVAGIIGGATTDEDEN